jgi:hypothetical protein
MKINKLTKNVLALNIAKSINEGKPVKEALSKSWNNSYKNLIHVDFVLGVGQRGEKLGYFKLTSITANGNRYDFGLEECSKEEIKLIETIIEGKNLKYIRRGKYLSPTNITSVS